MKSFCTYLILFIACGLNLNCSTGQDTVSRRTELEKLMLQGEYLHDGALELEHIGDINSVPALLVVLKKNPPRAKGVMVCTTAHALITLRKITGADAGVTYEDWSAWWEAHKAETSGSGQ